MAAHLLQSPARQGHPDMGGVNPARNAPPSPALSREQIKNRSSRGWSVSNNNGTSHNPSSQNSIPPLAFRSKAAAGQPQSQHYTSSTAMGRTISTDSNASSVASSSSLMSHQPPAMSPFDAGSPFGNILPQFQSPQVDNARKTSGSFKILDKKAVSNSPFLTGGNTRSATGAAYSPVSTNTIASPRKPFAPSSGFANWRNGDTNSAPSSPAGKGIVHGLGVFSSSSTGAPTSAKHDNNDNNNNNRPTSHRRSRSDVENHTPDYLSTEVLARPLSNYDDGKLSVPSSGNSRSINNRTKADLSPATQFNAEMETLGQPRAIDVTRGRSDSEESTSELPQLLGAFGQAGGGGGSAKSGQQRKPRPSVATLGHRATVSNSPFLSQSGPLSPGLASTLRDQEHLLREYVENQPVLPPSSSQPSSALNTSPRRGMLGPRAPSLTDIRSKADEQDFLNDFTAAYDDDQEPTTTLTSALTQHALSRKASKKSVKWAEMEEVCEFDVMTEDGDTSSRRSSSTGSSFNPNEEYGDSSFDENDAETKAQVQEILRKHGVTDIDVFGRGEASPMLDEQYYDQEQHGTTASRDILPSPLGASTSSPDDKRIVQNIKRDTSIISEHASLVDYNEEQDNSGSSYEEHETDGEIQQLIDQVEAASMSSRPTSKHLEDVFGSPPAQDEFGMRTPHSSTGGESILSLGTPQPLNRNGSLSRRPLPSPPVLPISRDLPLLSPGKNSDRQRGDSTDRNSFLLKASAADDSQFSLPDFGLGGETPFLDLKEMGLSRKESMKRSPGVNCHNSTPQKVANENAREELLPPLDLPERPLSPRSFLTAEDVRNSLRRKPSAIAHIEEAPLSSTPPNSSGMSYQSRLPLPPPKKQSDTPTSNSKAAANAKVISARPAPPPMKISSDQIPTLRSSTPIPSPTKEPESALDRLVREARAGDAEAVKALKGDWAQAYSASLVKDSIKDREEAIIAAKRAKKGLSASAGTGRRRRSLSVSDASSDSIEVDESLLAPATPKKGPLSSSAASNLRKAYTAPNSAGGPHLTENKQSEVGFGKQLGQALNDVVDFHEKGYRVREESRGVLAYSGASKQRISTVGDAGDIDAGGAWRRIKRPSDIHEHRTQIREYKQASASKARNTGALFVKIGKLRVGRELPIPADATYIACELFNGLDHVTTGVSQLRPETDIAQEFELIAHPNLEVTLSFKVRKDPVKDRHLLPRVAALAPPPSPGKHMATGSTSGGFRNGLRNLLSSPKKNKTRPASAMDIRASSPSPTLPGHPLLDYLGNDGELCRVSFKSETLVPDCTGRKLKTMHKCIPTRGSRRISTSHFELEITLFYLPPLPNVPVDKLPQSIDECIDGLLKAERHDKLLFQGILTQLGADCTIWRRRWFTLKGSRLIAYNEVTRQAHAVFDLAQAVKLDDPEETQPATPANTLNTPATTSTSRSPAMRESRHKRTLSYEDEDDPFSTRPNSFRIHFEDDTFIDLCADEDKPEEKAKWLVYLKPIINRDRKMRGFGTPPLWALTLRETLDSKTRKVSAERPSVPPK